MGDGGALAEGVCEGEGGSALGAEGRGVAGYAAVYEGRAGLAGFWGGVVKVARFALAEEG